jgi:opacity protein-like surface antigen
VHEARFGSRFVKGASMRFALTPAALAVIGAVAFAAPAAAEYDVAYLGLRGSYVQTDGGSTQGSVFFDFDEEYADGFAAGIFMGWVVDENFRLEIEGTYRSADLEEVTVVRDDLFLNTPGTVIAVGGDAQAGAVMTNLYYDLHFFDGAILPWIGAGVGGVFVDYQIDALIPDPLNPPTTYLVGAKDTTWVFGYQFMAGITFPIAEGTSMSVSYRYFQTQDFVYVDPTGEEFETDLTQQSIDVALQFHL